MNVIHKMLRKDCYVPLYIVIISLPGTADLEILCYFKLFSSIAKSAHNFSSLSFISFIAKSRAYIFLQTIVVNAKISRHFQFFPCLYNLLLFFLFIYHRVKFFLRYFQEKLLWSFPCFSWKIDDLLILCTCLGHTLYCAMIRANGDHVWSNIQWKL